MPATESAAKSYLFAYCERAGDPGFWAEPLNAVTNITFLVFAYLSYRLLRDAPSRRFKAIGDIWVLVAAMFGIGIGSGLWHTHAAAGWTVIADIIPIYIFINLYIFSLFMRQGGLRFWQAGVLWLVFQAGSVVMEMNFSRDTLNGSIMYLPSFVMLLLGTAWLGWRANAQWKAMALVTVAFTISLGFRTIDLMVCDQFPYGTHFLWHICNAYVLYRLVLIVTPKWERA